MFSNLRGLLLPGLRFTSKGLSPDDLGSEGHTTPWWKAEIIKMLVLHIYSLYAPGNEILRTADAFLCLAELRNGVNRCQCLFRVTTDGEKDAHAVAAGWTVDLPLGTKATLPGPVKPMPFPAGGRTHRSTSPSPVAPQSTLGS